MLTISVKFLKLNFKLKTPLRKIWNYLKKEKKSRRLSGYNSHVMISFGKLENVQAYKWLNGDCPSQHINVLVLKQGNATAVPMSSWFICKLHGYIMYLLTLLKTHHSQGNFNLNITLKLNERTAVGRIDCYFATLLIFIFVL